jgi:hypothetical protein
LLEHSQESKLDDLRVIKLGSRGHNVAKLRTIYTYTVLKPSPSELNEVSACFYIFDFVNVGFPKIACKYHVKPPSDAQAVDCPPSSTPGHKEIVSGG